MGEDIWNRYAEFYREVLPKISFFRELQNNVMELCKPYHRVLDAGCGPGLYFMELLEAGKDVHGIDLNENMIRILREVLGQKLEKEKNRLRIGNVSELPYKDNSFDAVININVLYSVENPLRALREMMRVTRHNGALVIAGPQPRSVFNREILKKQIMLDAKKHSDDKDFMNKIGYVIKINEEILDRHIANDFDLERIMALVAEAGYDKISYHTNKVYLGQSWLLKAEK